MEKDIIIIGGGPAGLSTALNLLKIDPNFASKILVLEKEHYPRPKLCAGGLVIDAEILLQNLGLDVSEIPHVDGTALHFNYARKGLTIRSPGQRLLRIIRRDEFDQWLADHAVERGIKIQQQVRVMAIRTTGSEVIVETSAGVYHAKVVVGSDGSNGIVRRCILPQESGSTARLLEVLVPPNGNPGHDPKEAYFDFSPVPRGIAGYTWDFPTQVKNQEMRCWGIYDTNLLARQKRAKLKDTLGEEMIHYGFNLDDAELKGHPIHLFNPFGKFCIPRVILIGDAAGADPLLGEGISFALGYGLITARELAKAFQKNDFSLQNYKKNLMLSPLGQALTFRWVISRLIYPLHWVWFQILLWRILKPLVIFLSGLFVINWAHRMVKFVAPVFPKQPSV